MKRQLIVIGLLVSSLLNAQNAVLRIGNGSVGDSSLTPNTSFGNTAIRVCHARYSFAMDGGTIGVITPANNCTIPSLSSIYMVSLRWTTPAVGALNTTSIGLTGTGGSPTALLTATVVGSLTGQVAASTISPATASTWLRITTPGTVTLTLAAGALTAGVCEIYLFYFTSST